MANFNSWSSIKEHLDTYRADPDRGHEHNPYGKVVPALLLTVTGRKTGKLRTLPLVYTKVDKGWAIIGSKGGADDHPQWYKNLRDNPDCQIQVRHDIIPVRARTVEGPEREPLWQQCVATLPQFAEYQTKTDRQIPVILLEPR